MKNSSASFRDRFADIPLIDKILVLFNIICILITSIYIFTGSIEYFTSDSAAYNILGRESFISGELYPQDWYTSTAVFGLGPNVLIWFFSNFSNDQILIRNLSVFVFYIILIISVIYLSKVLKSRSCLVIIPVLSIGFSEVYTEMIYSQAAYIGGVIISIILPALFISSVSDRNKINKLALILFVVLYSLYAHNSVMILQQITVPLIGAVVLYIFFRIYKDKKLDLHEYKSMLLITAILAVIALINLLIYKKVIEPNSLTEAYNSTLTVMMTPDKILNNISVFFQSVLYVTGFGYGVNILSVAGIMAIIRVVCCAALILVFPIKLAVKYKEQSDTVKLFMLFVFVHVAEVFIICFWGTLPDMYAGGRYMITSVSLLSILGVYYIYTYILKERNVLSVAYLLFIFAYLAVDAVPIIQSSADYKNITAGKKGLSDFLYENELTYGYATFWNSANNSVISDFKVQINPVNVSAEDISPYYWLCVGRYFDPENYSGKSFLLLTDTEAAQYEESNSYSKLGAPDDVLHYNGYSIYVYPYNISENNFNGVKKLIGAEISFSKSENNTDVLGSGWSDLEDWGVWSVGNENVLNFGIPSDTTGTLELSVDLFSFHEPRDLGVYINDKLLDTITVDVDSKTYSLSIPEDYYKDGAPYGLGRLMTVKFTQTAEVSPHDLDENLSDTRDLGVGMSRLVINQQ